MAKILVNAHRHKTNSWSPNTKKVTERSVEFVCLCNTDFVNETGNDWPRRWGRLSSCHASQLPSPLVTRNSSGDEIANVNFIYDDIVHALENTIDSCINCATDRLLQLRFNKFTEITQCNGHYAVQGHSRSPILVPIESSYTIVINTNLPPILHRFQVMADYWSYFR